jgi:hypothetical protein
VGPQALTGPRGSIPDYLAAAPSIPGWFADDDVALFRWAHAVQVDAGIHGDLLEIGVYQGRSAILLGYFVRGGERLVVCDPFGGPVEDAANTAENTRFYGALQRRDFERNFRRFHHGLPVVLDCPSCRIVEHGALAPTFRFVHVDGSHVYDVVRGDIDVARRLLIDGGLVVLDDFRAPHTPGVAAAAWQELARGDLAAVCVTDQKLYACWSRDHAEYVAALERRVADFLAADVDEHPVLGRRLLHVHPRTTVAPDRDGGRGPRARWFRR